MSTEHLNQPQSKYESPEESSRIASEMEKRYLVRELTTPSEVCVIDSTCQENQPMAFSNNPTLGVEQHLMAEIDAGQEKFFVANCFVSTEKGKVSATVLSRHIAGSRPEIVSIIEEDEILKIGRTAEGDFAPSLSRQHFEIAKSQDGRIGIADVGSANHTKIFSTQRGHHYQTDMSDKENPIANPSYWSTESKKIKEYLTR